MHTMNNYSYHSVLCGADRLAPLIYRKRGKIRRAKHSRFQPCEVFRGNTSAVHWASVFIIRSGYSYGKNSRDKLSRYSRKRRKFSLENLSPFTVVNALGTIHLLPSFLIKLALYTVQLTRNVALARARESFYPRARVILPASKSHFTREHESFHPRARDISPASTRHFTREHESFHWRARVS